MLAGCSAKQVQQKTTYVTISEEYLKDCESVKAWSLEYDDIVEWGTINFKNIQTCNIMLKAAREENEAHKGVK